MRRLTTWSVVLMAAVALTASAQEANDNAGTRAAAFLKMESGARGAALSGAYTGLADDVDGLFWNPASIAAVEGKQLTGSQNWSFGGINHSTLAYGQRLDDNSVIAASFQGVFASIERRIGDTLEPDSEFTASTYGVGLTYARTVGDLAAGVTVKALQERFDVEDHSGLSVDVGAVYAIGKFTAGASAQNLGPKLGDSSLPMTIRAGGSMLLADDGPRFMAD
ncbi:MAG: PorV/PorQ family protein, partial [Candidatus Poribacteria bacterium]|nr:PorV/PorQ family protein [Candidatus Poribacteria bacterium]